MEETSHKEIVKSTGILGGAQILTIMIGIAKTKIVAVLLGPVGFGITALLQSVVDLMRSITGFGINFSGVKDIAEANSTDNQEKIYYRILILKRWANATGILGMVLTIIFAIPLSKYSFGNVNYAISIGFISVMLWITSVYSANNAILQGLRKIKQMASGSIVSTILSFVITVPLYWIFGNKAIVPALIATSVIGFSVTTFYLRKLKKVPMTVSMKETFASGISMAKLGFFIVINGFVATITMYVVRSMVSQHEGLIGVGMFQASWTISEIYLGILLNAMLTDFFPRLSAINKDKSLVNKITNEQSEITLILGATVMIIMIVCAPIIIHLLYSSEFAGTVSILRWQLSGSVLSLIMWPAGVIFLSLNKGKFSVLTDLIWSISYCVLIWLGWPYFGLEIVGIAFCLAAFIKLIFVLYLVNRISGFTFSFRNKKLIIVYCSLTTLAMMNVYLVKILAINMSVAVIIIISISIFSYVKLNQLINLRQIILDFKRKFIR